MYGIIGRAKAVPGQREALVRILLQASRDMPGCLSYVVAKDRDDPQAIWITEVWQDRASHEESLTLPQVREAIASGRPLIEEFDERIETEPVGGWGLRGRSSVETPIEKSE